MSCWWPVPNSPQVSKLTESRREVVCSSFSSFLSSLIQHLFGGVCSLSHRLSSCLKELGVQKKGKVALYKEIEGEGFCKQLRAPGGSGEAEQGRRRTRFLGGEQGCELVTDRTCPQIENHDSSPRRHKELG